MNIAKIAIWFDPKWHSHFKQSWSNLHYWWTRTATFTTGSYTLGPLRVEVNLNNISKSTAEKLQKLLHWKG